MANFNVIFAGLICHLRLNDFARAAVIVRDPNHRPWIWVRTGGVINSTFTTDTSPDLGWQVFKIAADARILFTHLVQGKRAADPPTTTVPSLNEFITGFDPLNEVTATHPHSNVAGFVEYRGGTFSVTCYYRERVRFRTANPYECRARELRWTAQSTGNVIITDVNNGDRMEVKGDTTIAVTQLDKMLSAGDHTLYKNLSKRPVTPLPMDIGMSNCTSTSGELPWTLFTSVTVECVNSQWP